MYSEKARQEMMGSERRKRASQKTAWNMSEMLKQYRSQRNQPYFELGFTQGHEILLSLYRTGMNLVQIRTGLSTLNRVDFHLLYNKKTRSNYSNLRELISSFPGDSDRKELLLTLLLEIQS